MNSEKKARLESDFSLSAETLVPEDEEEETL